MTLHDFFLGGSAVRVAILFVGVGYCVRYGRIRSLAMLCLLASAAVLALLIVSREWATLLGVPVTWLVVERLTELVRQERERDRLLSLIEDQHSINEQLLDQLKRS